MGCCPWSRTEPDTTEATQRACVHWRRKWQPTPVFLPGESQGQRSLVGCSLWCRTESDTTEATQHGCLHWRRKWQPTPVFLPGESQEQRSLVGCRLWGRRESDTTEAPQQQQRQQQAELPEITLRTTIQNYSRMTTDTPGNTENSAPSASVKRCYQPTQTCTCAATCPTMAATLTAISANNRARLKEEHTTESNGVTCLCIRMQE